MFTSVIDELRFFSSVIALYKVPTVWLDGTSPANTCIPPSVGWIMPMQHAHATCGEQPVN